MLPLPVKRFIKALLAFSVANGRNSRPWQSLISAIADFRGEQHHLLTEPFIKLRLYKWWPWILSIAISTMLSVAAGALIAIVKNAQEYVRRDTIAPQRTAFVAGITPAEMIRVKNVANMETLLNIAAYGLEVAGVIGGVAILVQVFLKPISQKTRITLLVSGFGLILVGLLIPVAINSVVKSITGFDGF